MRLFASIIFFYSLLTFSFGQVNPSANRKASTQATQVILDRHTALSETNVLRLIHHYKALEVNPEGIPGRFQFSVLNDLKSDEHWKELSNQLPLFIGYGTESGVGFELSEHQTDGQQNQHLKFDQTYFGLPVFTGQYLLHVYKDQSVLAHGKAELPDQKRIPLIDESRAFQTGKEYLNNSSEGTLQNSNSTSSYDLKSSELGYWKNGSMNQWNLVYRLKLVKDGVFPWVVYVDAEANTVLKSIKNYCGFCRSRDHNETHGYPQCEAHAEDILSGETTTAKDLQDVDRTINVWREGADVYLIDASKPMFNSGNFTLNNPAGVIWTQDAQNGSDPKAAVQISSSTNTFPKAGVAAHYHAGLVYDYFLNTHNRNSINGNGGRFRSLINFGSNYEGAFWADNTVHYGNGNISKGYMDFAGAMDVNAHEITHGIIDATSGLEYDGESGAINESFADIFGVMVDRDDWGLGEDIIISGHPDFPTGLQRNMANPQQGLTNTHWLWQPDHVKNQYMGAGDAGGVHLNSGIPNFAFYKFVQGLIPMVGTEEAAKQVAEKVYYHAMTFYLTRQANFKDLRAAIEHSCSDLHPLDPGIRQKASEAFEAVGIVASSEPGGGIFDFQASDLTPNQGTEYVLCSKFNFNKNKNEGLYISESSKINLSKISDLSLLSRPSVLDDGSAMYFVASDNKIYKLTFNPSTKAWDPSVVKEQPNYRNVAVSKDGRFLAILEKQVKDNNAVVILDLIANVERKFLLTNPVFDVNVKKSRVAEISNIVFDHSGRYLMYDCYNEHTHNSGYKYNQWDIGFLRFWNLSEDKFGDGAIEKLLKAPLASPGAKRLYHFKNPGFSKNSQTVMVMDFYISDYINPNTPLENAVVACDVEKGEFQYIQEKTKGFGFPNYSVLDDKVSFDDGFTSSPGKPSKSSVISLDQTKMKSQGMSSLLVQGYRWGTFFAQGKRTKSNSLPVATNDQFDVNEDHELIAFAYTNDALSLDIPNIFKLKGINGGASNGTVRMEEDGKFYYNPNPNFHGMDEFLYELCDRDMDCATGKITIIVNSINDLPIATHDDFTIQEDEELAADASLNDTSSGDGSNFWKLIGQNGGAMHGTVTMDSTGKFIYTAEPDYFGNDEFSYTLCDKDSDCATAVVTIRIFSGNDKPVATDDNYSLDEDMVYLGNVSLNDTLSGDGTNDYKLIGPDGGARHARVSMTTDGAFIYKPDPNYNGTDEFTYEICDKNMDCSQATVSLFIRPVNDFPVAVEDHFITLEDIELNESVAGNDTPSGDIVDTWRLVGIHGGAMGGTVVLNTNGDFRYIPRLDFHGLDQFQYELCDGNQDCSMATAYIRVKPFNDSPEAVNDDFTILKNEVLMATVIPNDTRSGDGNNFWRLSGLNGGAQNGKVVMNSDGSFVYKPDLDYCGTDQFIYKLCDNFCDCSMATVTINILASSALPIAFDDQFELNEDSEISGNLLDNDSLSADGNNRLQLKGVNGGASHGQVISHESGYFRYLPQANYYGPDEFVYILCDRNNDCVEAVVSLQVHSVNDLPISEDDVFTFNEDESLQSAVSTNDNPSGDGGNRWNLNGLNGGAAHGTVTMDLQGSIQYTPKENYYGADLFTYTLCDINNDCVSARVYIQINPINDLPVSYDDVVSLQQAQIYFGDVSGNDLMSGDGGNEWLLELNRGLAQHGTVTFNGDGHYTYSPDPNYYGTDEFTYKLCDVDGDCSEARVSLNIAQIVGTGQTEGLQELLVSPNPVYENAQLTLKGFSGPVSCSIYNAMGIQLFDSGVLNAHELFNLNIDASSFQTGIYLVELKGEHLHLVRKIVKH